MLQTTLGMSAEAQRRGAARATMLSVLGIQGCLPLGPPLGHVQCHAGPQKPGEGQWGPLLQVLVRAMGCRHVDATPAPTPPT